MIGMCCPHTHKYFHVKTICSSATFSAIDICSVSFHNILHLTQRFHKLLWYSLLSLFYIILQFHLVELKIYIMSFQIFCSCFFLMVDCLLGPIIFTIVNFKEKTSNNSKCFIQHGLMPFNLAIAFPADVKT